MPKFIESLNFSQTVGDHRAIAIPKWRDVNHYETLCLYCSNNDIDLDNVSDQDFEDASEIMAEHGQEYKSTDSYFFWIS